MHHTAGFLSNRLHIWICELLSGMPRTCLCGSRLSIGNSGVPGKHLACDPQCLSLHTRRQTSSSQQESQSLCVLDDQDWMPILDGRLVPKWCHLEPIPPKTYCFPIELELLWQLGDVYLPFTSCFLHFPTIWTWSLCWSCSVHSKNSFGRGRVMLVIQFFYGKVRESVMEHEITHVFASTVPPRGADLFEH